MKNVTIMYMKPNEKSYEITFRVIYVELHIWTVMRIPNVKRCREHYMKHRLKRHV